MMLEFLALNPLRKQMFHQNYIHLRSLIIIYVYERFFKSWRDFMSLRGRNMSAIQEEEALYPNLKNLS